MKLVCWLLLFAAPLAAQEPVVTKHYEVHADFEADAKETTLLYEAAWKELNKAFKAKPKVPKSRKLVVRRFAKRDAFLAALKEAGAPEPGDDGAYWPGNQTAYVVRQGTGYEDRALQLREIARQFHYLARARNKDPVAYWWRQGVCEFWSGHEWNGSTLKLGVPSLSSRDLPGEALRSKDDLIEVIEAKVDGGPGLAWALYAHISTLKKFDKFARKMDGGVKPVPMFFKSFGAPKEYEAAFKKWLAATQQPWVPIHPDWEARGPGRMRGVAKKVSAIRLQAPATQFKGTIQAPQTKTRWRAGAVLHYAGADDWSIFLVDWAGYLRITRFLGGRWQILEQGPGPGASEDGKYHFELFRRKDQVYLMFKGGASYGPWELPGSGFGLAIENCDLTFSDLSWK